MKWIPAWGENRIGGTVESRPDWVISRQRSWGVPLPVFYSKDGEAILDAQIIRRLADLVAGRSTNIWFELSDADLARELGLPPGTTKRNDTIDVWIDSGVSHRAVCALHPELRDPADMAAASAVHRNDGFCGQLHVTTRPGQARVDRSRRPVTAAVERRRERELDDGDQLIERPAPTDALHVRVQVRNAVLDRKTPLQRVRMTFDVDVAFIVDGRRARA